MKPLRSLAVSLFLFLAWHSIAAGQSWQPLNNQPSFGASTSLLLTNGTVLVQGNNGDYWGLTPDNTGSYVNGTWTQLASLPPGYNPDAYASAVLRDGRVILEGGEYNNGQNDWTNQGAIYNPKTNKWKSVAPPSGWNIIGDAESVVLSDGTFMVANCCSFPYLAALLDATNLTWTPTGLNKQDSYDEEGWLLLPDGTVLTVDCENGADPKHAEKYIPSLGEWVSAGDTGVLLSDPPTAEIGPMVLRPDGTVFATGANSTGGAGHTSVYYPPKDPMSPGKWVPGPDIPDGNDLADAPAALLPDGNVLLDTSPGYGNPPSTFFEYNGTGYVKVPAPPNAAHESSEGGSMLELPTGQIFFTDGSSD
ncbi:MAG TPA: kelch repeat-containing protein, partial [Terriglobales bacterium]